MSKYRKWDLFSGKGTKRHQNFYILHTKKNVFESQDISYSFFSLVFNFKFLHDVHENSLCNVLHSSCKAFQEICKSGWCLWSAMDTAVQFIQDVFDWPYDFDNQSMKSIFRCWRKTIHVDMGAICGLACCWNVKPGLMHDNWQLLRLKLCFCISLWSLKQIVRSITLLP